MTNLVIDFTNTHLYVESPCKLTPEFDRYLVSKGINMGAGQDSDELLYCYSFPREKTGGR